MAALFLFAIAVGVFLALAAASVILAVLAVSVTVLAGLAGLSRILFPAGRHTRALAIGREGRLTLELDDGSRAEGRAGDRRYVSRFWVILPWNGPDGPGQLVLTRDMFSEDAFRKLRLWALWGKNADSEN